MSPTTSTPRTSSPSSSHRPVFSSRDARRSAMAAQPEQIGLPAVVALVYRADWTRLRLSGTVYTRHDLALRNRMSQVQATGEPLPGLFGRWLRSAQSGQPQSGPDPEPDGVTGGRVLFAPGGHYRIELTHEDGPGLTVCDGESRWDVRRDVATREDADGPPALLADLLTPSQLLTEFDFELTGTSVVSGRTAHRVLATPRAAVSGTGVIRRRQPDQAFALVDAELGILLSYEEVFDGQQLKITELTDLLLDPPAAAEPGQFLPPPGMPVRDDGRPRDRNYALPGVVGQAARLVAGPAAAAIGFAARHLGQGSPDPSAQAADEAGIPVAPRAPDRAQLTPLTAGGEVEVDGRRGFLVVADGVDGLDGKWPGDLFPMTDHVEVVMDAQLGIALRETCYFQGEPFHCIELRDVSGQVDPRAFRIDIPAGTRTVGTGLLSDLDMPTPVKVGRLAAGLGVTGVVALTGWLQKRPSQPPGSGSGSGSGRS